MTGFAVGDVVEVVYVHKHANASWVGRRLVVTDPNVPVPPQYDSLGAPLRILTAPMPKYGRGPWKPDQLRKINPPDWQAPRVTDKELTT